MTDNTDALPPLPDFDRWWREYIFEATPQDESFAEAERCARVVWNAALAAQQGAQVPQWQPIETAPRKDQMRALVAWPIDAGGGYVEEAWFDLARDQWWPANTDYTDSHGSPLYPSHWMPLPPPPSASPQAPAQPVNCPACGYELDAPPQRAVEPLTPAQAGALWKVGMTPHEYATEVAKALGITKEQPKT